MTPWDILGWVAGIGGSVVIVAITVLVVVASVRAIRNPATKKTPTSIMRGES